MSYVLDTQLGRGREGTHVQPTCNLVPALLGRGILWSLNRNVTASNEFCLQNDLLGAAKRWSLN